MNFFSSKGAKWNGRIHTSTKAKGGRLQLELNTLAELKRVVRKYRRSLFTLAALALIAVIAQAITPHLIPQVSVLVANRDLTSGEAVTATDFSEQQFPAHLVPPNSLTDLPNYENRVLATGISQGVVLTNGNFAKSPDALPAEMAITALPIKDQNLLQIIKVGNVLHLTCINEFEQKSHTLELEVHSISQNQAQNGHGFAFQNQNGTSILVTIPKAKLGSMAHCTPATSQILAIIR